MGSLPHQLADGNMFRHKELQMRKSFFVVRTAGMEPIFQQRRAPLPITFGIGLHLEAWAMLGQTEGVFKPICMPVLVSGGITAGSESSLEIIKPTRSLFALILLLYAHDNQQYSILKMSPSRLTISEQPANKGRGARGVGMKQRRRWRKISLFDGQPVVCEAEALLEIPLQELKKNPGDGSNKRALEHLPQRSQSMLVFFVCLL